jgi:NADH-quinone oxidoreductase subunit L
MVWLGPFFGDHAKVNEFFGIPAHTVSADAGHGAGEGEGEPATARDIGDSHGDAVAEENAHGTVAAHAGAPVGAIFMAPDNHVMANAHKSPAWVKVSPFVAMVIGLVVAWWFYIVNPALPKRLAEIFPMFHRFLLNKWYFDEIYDAIFVRPAMAIGRFLWKTGDGKMIDGAINGVALGIIPFFTRLAGRAQTGYIFTYALVMVLGVVGLITWMAISGGAH